MIHYLYYHVFYDEWKDSSGNQADEFKRLALKKEELEVPSIFQDGQTWPMPDKPIVTQN